jgi:hypothetical protein
MSRWVSLNHARAKGDGGPVPVPSHRYEKAL